MKKQNYFTDFWRFLRSTPGDANSLAIATIVVWTGKAIFLDDIPELFPKAFELGKIVDGFLSAVVAGWVFYLFFALLPEFKQRRLIAPYVLRKVADILTDCHYILHQIEQASGRTLDFANCTVADLDSAMEGISYEAKTLIMPELRGKMSWLDLFQQRRQRSLEAIAELMGLSRYLDHKLVALILGIGENVFFVAARVLDGLPSKNMDLSVFADPLSRYLELCRELARWHKEHSYTHTLAHAQPFWHGGRHWHDVRSEGDPG